MTIDEVIKQLLNEAEKWESLINGAYGLQDRECAERANNHRQLVEWLTELRELRSLKTDYVFFKAEAKKLLKAAVEDFAHMDFHIYECDGMCDTCPLHGERDNCLVWQYADEAEKLLKEE